MIKKVLKKLIYGKTYDSKSYIKHLRKIGCTIGKETKIYAPRNTLIDEQRPWLIEIGDNVQITDGVRILTHGYDWSVLKVKYGEALGSSGAVKIGNNVFIGVNTTILKNVTIGDNIIIGANSLVNKNLTKPGVYAGNPAKYIMSLDNYYTKRQKHQLDEAYECAVKYFEVYHKFPPKEIFREFFWLFEERNVELCDAYAEVMKLEGNEQATYDQYKKVPRQFNGFNAFMDYVKERYANDQKDIH